MWRLRLAVLACVLALGGAGSALAEARADQAAITRQLQRWADAFNAKDMALACDLFAADLVATVPGAPERGRTALCDGLAALLAKPGQQFRYTLNIQEIIVSGDLAVVRLVWTLQVSHGSAEHVSEEHGLDVFRRGADGTWRIIRFMAFSTGPDS